MANGNRAGGRSDLEADNRIETMKIGDTKSVNRGTAVAGRSYGPSGRREGVGQPATGTVDRADFMGIPETELTPKVRSAIMTLMAEVDRLRSELASSRQRFDELERDANLDPLVPVFNRRAFVREIGRAISMASRYNIPASLVYLDLNHFKTVNDSHGHAAGDAALIHIGQLLSSHVRESDVVGRLGGDEFGVLLAGATPEVAQHKAASLADLIANTPFVWQDHPIALVVAFGVYTFKQGEDATEAMANADRAMFARKRDMKNSDEHSE